VLDSLEGVDIALFSAGGGISKQYGPVCMEKGVIVSMHHPPDAHPSRFGHTHITHMRAEATARSASSTGRCAWRRVYRERTPPSRCTRLWMHTPLASLTHISPIRKRYGPVCLEKVVIVSMHHPLDAHPSSPGHTCRLSPTRL
jgi:hypothetical protein